MKTVIDTTETNVMNFLHNYNQVTFYERYFKKMSISLKNVKKIYFLIVKSVNFYWTYFEL